MASLSHADSFSILHIAAMPNSPFPLTVSRSRKGSQNARTALPPCDKQQLAQLYDRARKAVAACRLSSKLRIQLRATPQDIRSILCFWKNNSALYESGFSKYVEAAECCRSKRPSDQLILSIWQLKQLAHEHILAHQASTALPPLVIEPRHIVPLTAHEVVLLRRRPKLEQLCHGLIQSNLQSFAAACEASVVLRGAADPGAASIAGAASAIASPALSAEGELSVLT